MVRGAAMTPALMLAAAMSLGGCWADFPDGPLGDGVQGRPPDSTPAGERSQDPGCSDDDGDGHEACQGDCNDRDDRVFPGQQRFFDGPSAGSFDYDCDGVEQAEVPDVFAGACELVDGQCEGQGWRDEVPACGERGELVTCELRRERCSERQREERLRCR